MELPWDVLTVVAGHLHGRARPVCRAFVEDQRRVREALAALPDLHTGEVSVGPLWTVRLWRDGPGTLTLACDEVPYAGLRRALMCAPPETLVSEGGLPSVARSEWFDPQHEPALSLSEVPLRPAAAFLANLGRVHGVTCERVTSRLVTALPPPATAGEWATLEAPVLARSYLRRMGAPVPPPLTRLPCGAWFRGRTQVAEPADLEEILAALRSLPSRRWRAARYVVSSRRTLLGDAGSLRELASAASWRHRPSQ